jgi:molybdenum cofactor biosynthesis protein B
VGTIPANHRAAAPQRIRCAVLTISDTRSVDDDRGGASVQDHLERASHQLAERAICPDDPAQIREYLERWAARSDVDAILMTGGTGISHRDQTYETVRALLTRELPGYGELFRWLSYQEIGTAAMISRAVGGLINTTVVLTMPGSPAAVRLAMQRIILPELGHLVSQARS